jgi:hypothetical protein
MRHGYIWNAVSAPDAKTKSDSRLYPQRPDEFFRLAVADFHYGALQPMIRVGAGRDVDVIVKVVPDAEPRQVLWRILSSLLGA